MVHISILLKFVFILLQSDPNAHIEPIIDINFEFGEVNKIFLAFMEYPSIFMINSKFLQQINILYVIDSKDTHSHDTDSKHSF